MICSCRLSDRWQQGDIWRVVNNGGRFGRRSDEVYAFDSSEVFGPNHALAMCALGSVVGWVHSNCTLLGPKAKFFVCTDEMDRLQMAIDEGCVEFYIEEQRS